MSIVEPSLANLALDMSPMGVVITDVDGRISWINKTMQSFLNSDLDSLLGHEFSSVANDFCQFGSDNSRLWRIPDHAQKEERWLLQVEQQIAPGFTAYYFSDSSELIRLKNKTSQLVDQLENTATSDPVTGVLNQRALMQGLEPQVSRSRRYENPLSLVIMEVDGFESSDSVVSAVTEHVLRGIGFYLRDQLRWVDLVGRTGDREFTLVLPETRFDDAQAIANKIMQRLGQLSLPETPNLTVKVEARIGIAEWQKGNDTSTLLNRAREAMQDWAATA